MSIFGGAIKIAGKVAGKVGQYSVVGTGLAVGIVAEIANKPNIAKKSFEISNSIGKVVEEAGSALGNGLGFVADKALECGSKVGGEIGGGVVEMMGGDANQIKIAKNIGTVVGGGLVGLATGELIGSVVMGVTAATGVASTGTAISTLSGVAAESATLAAIGGGTLAAGGGGIAAGQAILSGITATTTIIAGAESTKNIDKVRVDRLLVDESKIVEAEYEIE